MKKLLYITLFGILLSSCSIKNEKESRNLETFHTVHVVGNMELHLEKNSSNSIEVLAKNTTDIADLITEIRDGELYIYHQKECDNCQTPKYSITLNHSGISNVNLNGIISLNSGDGISQKDLVIRGDGIFNGNLEVSVNNLNVHLKGISNMSISGTADTSTLKVTGIGMIHAARLKTKSGKNVTKGIAFINE